jgi:hypothetical protein
MALVNSKKLASEWSAFTPEEKGKYNEVAERDKERYAREWAEYTLTEDYRKFMAEKSQGWNLPNESMHLLCSEIQVQMK